MIRQINPFAFVPVYASLNATHRIMTGNYKKSSVKAEANGLVPIMFWLDGSQPAATSITVYDASDDSVVTSTSGSLVTATETTDVNGDVRTVYTFDLGVGSLSCSFVYVRFVISGISYYTHTMQLQPNGGNTQGERFYLEISDTRNSVGKKYYPSGFSERFYFNGYLANQNTEREEDVLILGDGTRKLLRADSGYFGTLIVENVPEPLFPALQALSDHDTITLHRVNPSFSWTLPYPQETSFEVRPRENGYANQGVLRWCAERVQTRNFRNVSVS